MKKVQLDAYSLMGVRACLNVGKTDQEPAMLGAKEGVPNKDGTSCDDQPVMLGRKEGINPTKGPKRGT